MKTVKFVIFIIYMQECNSTSKIKSNFQDKAYACTNNIFATVSEIVFVILLATI